MTKARRYEKYHADDMPEWLPELLECVRNGKAVRKDFDDDSRLHIDRPMPFLALFLTKGREDLAARDIAAANASYLVAADVAQAVPIIRTLGAILHARFGAFMLLVYDELEHDRFLTDDAPYLPPFEIRLSSSDEGHAKAALKAISLSADNQPVRFRTPKIEHVPIHEDEETDRLRREAGFPVIAVRFAPVYRQPESGAVYPEMRERLIADIFDGGLKALAAFVAATRSLKINTHRALGRQAFVDAVSRADRSMDEVASTFDFLLAVTPINADMAWNEFRESGFGRAPRFLYRPLSMQLETEKRRLFSIAFDRFEDPVLYHLYREKQQELDLQLSLIAARESDRFIEYGRALYGPVEASLLGHAKDILAATARRHEDEEGGGDFETADYCEVERQARAMLVDYHEQYDGFDAEIELRDDLPSGLLVSGSRLLISRSTSMPRSRVHALLSHEIGVHLLTYFNGSAQGLRLFRTGLSGYEGMQEGLAVFSEYMAGGMTVGRLRLIAARVVGCAMMLNGRTFSETFGLLVEEHGFSHPAAFNLSLRLYRGGGLAKDAIYLRGLLELLSHLKAGGALDPFWMGKISASHFQVMQELNLRGLLKAPVIRPAFLKTPQAKVRLDRAREGLDPLDLINI